MTEPVGLTWQSRAEQNGTGWTPGNLRKHFTPKTVIDVGVAQGTPGLYGAFPGVRYVLVEPVAEFEGRLRELVSTIPNCEYHLTAVGETNNSVEMQVDTEALALSSIHPVSHRPHATKELDRRTVPMVTLDALRDGWEPPFGLKIDTEGSEDQVIRGATELLRETQFVIAEVNVAPRFAGSYGFADFVALMDSHGFRFCDLLDGLKRHREAELIFVDAVFTRS